MSDALYASLGRKQIELDQLHVEYDRLLDLLDHVVMGDIALDRVRVDRTGRRWSVLAPVLEKDDILSPVNGKQRAAASREAE